MYLHTLQPENFFACLENDRIHATNSLQPSPNVDKNRKALVKKKEVKQKRGKFIEVCRTGCIDACLYEGLSFL